MQNSNFIRASHAQPTVDSIIVMIKTVLSKNRALLSVEDVNLLEYCLKELNKLKDEDKSSGKKQRIAKIVTILLRLFTEVDNIKDLL